MVVENRASVLELDTSVRCAEGLSLANQSEVSCSESSAHVDFSTFERASRSLHLVQD